MGRDGGETLDCDADDDDAATDRPRFPGFAASAAAGRSPEPRRLRSLPGPPRPTPSRLARPAGSTGPRAGVREGSTIPEAMPKNPRVPVLPGTRVAGGVTMDARSWWRGVLAAVLLAPAAAQAGAPGHSCWTPGACRGGETYAVVDAIFLQRDNYSNPTDLVFDGDTLAPVIGARDMQFATAPGLRAFYGRHGCCGPGWELGYTGVYGMFAEAAATGPGNLEIAPPLSSLVPGLANASLARTTYGSTLNSAEANVLLTDTWVHRPRLSGYRAEAHAATATVDWLAGFRWAGLDESASITLAEPADAVAGTYAVRSSSNLFGGQLGARGRIEWRNWAVEGWLKAAVAGAGLAQSQDAIVDPITGFVERSARGSSTGTVGGIFDLAGTLVYRIDDTWGLRVGYGMMWLTGVALAPDQFDFAATAGAGTAVDGNATLWLGGASLGLEARW